MKHLSIKILILIVSIFFLNTNISFASKGIAQKIEDRIGLYENAPAQERIALIGQRVATACDRKDVIFTFKILDEDEINAFILPNGYVYMYKGLYEKLETDDEIAAVLAHELGHMAARHHDERSRRGMLTSIFGMIAVQGAETRQDKININNALIEFTLSYSREEEIEADRLSAKYLQRAGYDPEAVISVIDILIKSELEGPIKPKRYYRTHPYLTDRIRAAREQIHGNINFMDYANTPTHGVER